MLAKKKQNQNNSVTATVADDHLVLSLPNAIEPIIWRKSLEKIGSAIFEVKKAAGKETFNLTLKKTKASSEIIASFDNKDDAVTALNAASNAFHGRGTSHNTAISSTITPATVPAQSQGQQNPDNNGQKWILAAIAAAIVIGLYIYMMNTMPVPNVIGDTQTMATSQGPVTPDLTGVPVSADDFLSGM